MQNTWNTIDDQMQNAHDKVSNVIEKSESNFWKSHKVSIISALFGLVLLTASFIMPGTGSFMANMFTLPNIDEATNVNKTEEQEKPKEQEFTFEEDDPQLLNEAKEVEVDPLVSSSNESTTPSTTNESTTPSATSIPSPFSSVSTLSNPSNKKDDVINPDITTSIDNKDTETDTSMPISEPSNTESETDLNTEIDKEELNPFASVNDNNPDDSFNTETTDETEENPFLKSNKNEFNDSSADDSSYKIPPMFTENTYTYDKSESDYSEDIGEISDPLNEDANLEVPEIGSEDSLITSSSSLLEDEYNKDEELLHGAANSKTKSEKEKNGTYKGVLLSSSPSIGSIYPFAFNLKLADGRKIHIDTNRDLRKVVGDEISIEIEGTIDDFVLQHVYWEGNKKLISTGPETFVILIAVFAYFASVVIRRKV